MTGDAYICIEAFPWVLLLLRLRRGVAGDFILTLQPGALDFHVVAGIAAFTCCSYTVQLRHGLARSTLIINTTGEYSLLRHSVRNYMHTWTNDTLARSLDYLNMRHPKPATQMSMVESLLLHPAFDATEEEKFMLVDRVRVIMAKRARSRKKTPAAATGDDGAETSAESEVEVGEHEPVSVAAKLSKKLAPHGYEWFTKGGATSKGITEEESDIALEKSTSDHFRR